MQGKSALAAAVGRHLWGQGLLPGGALYADLKGVGTQAAALNKIALSMGIKQVHESCVHPASICMYACWMLMGRCVHVCLFCMSSAINCHTLQSCCLRTVPLSLMRLAQAISNWLVHGDFLPIVQHH